MARKRIALSQFAAVGERDDSGVQLMHYYRRCDWDAYVDGMSPNAVRRVARDHARVCDGQPQPRPERPASPASPGFIPELWAAEVSRALATSFVTSVQALRRF
jgi:hypothetical protein